jgi:translation initiation factor IF-3
MTWRSARARDGERDKREMREWLEEGDVSKPWVEMDGRER